MEAFFEKHPELKEAWEKLKPYCAEVEYIDSGVYQGGEEDAFKKGHTQPGVNCFVFSPDAKPYEADEE